jgi:glycosyltransferase involved in cell wall biosynthesis
MNAVNSALHQSLPADEIIVIDNGSTNETISQLKALNLARVSVVSQPHIGGSATLNRGVWESENDFIAFLDPQYELSPVFLEVMLDMMLTFPQARCLTSAHQTDYSERYSKLLCDIDDLDNVGILPNDYFSSFSDDSTLPFKISSTLVHRTLIEELGGFPNVKKQMENLMFFYDANKISQIAYITNIHEFETNTADHPPIERSRGYHDLSCHRSSFNNNRSMRITHHSNRDTVRQQVLRKAF